MSEMNSSQKIRAYRQSLIGKRVGIAFYSSDNVLSMIFQLHDWADGWLLVENGYQQMMLLSERAVKFIFDTEKATNRSGIA